MLVVVYGFVSKLHWITTIVTYTIKKLGKFLIKAFKEFVSGIGVGQSYTQVSPKYIYPMFQGHNISHLKTIFSSMKHKPFVCMCANRFSIIQHGQVNVAAAYKTFPRVQL